MTIKEYIEDVLRTKDESLNRTETFTYSMLKMSEEVGEIQSIITKCLYQGHNIDYNKLTEEIGDLMFFIILLINATDLDFMEILEYNVEKRQILYPDGFDPERSRNRTEVVK